MNIVSVLKKDGIGILPTDTLYGVVGSAHSKKAVSRIYEVKGRNHGKPLIILISSLTDLKRFGIALDKKQEEYLMTLWPGPFSVILPCRHAQFAYLHRGTKSLAFRMPKSKKLRDFLKHTGPLVAPSANPQGMKPAHTIAEAKKYFGTEVDFYVSGGRKVGKPSKVISLLSVKPTVVRK